MTISPAHYKFLLDAKAICQEQQALLGSLVKLDALWNGAPDYDAGITQEAIDSKPNLLASGYTYAEIADAIYALSVIKGVIVDHLAALSRLSDLP